MKTFYYLDCQLPLWPFLVSVCVRLSLPPTVYHNILSVLKALLHYSCLKSFSDLIRGKELKVLDIGWIYKSHAT